MVFPNLHCHTAIIMSGSLHRIHSLVRGHNGPEHPPSPSLPLLQAVWPLLWVGWTWNGGVRDVAGGVPPTLEVAYARTSRCKMLETNNVSETGKNEAGAGGGWGKHVGENEKKLMRKRHFAKGALGEMKQLFWEGATV